MSAGIKLGWAVFAVLVILLLGYGLTRGIFFGSTTRYHSGNSAYYSYECRYLYADGFRLRWGGGTGHTPEEAADDGSYCPFLANEK
jgi:hypothetical protein